MVCELGFFLVDYLVDLSYLRVNLQVILIFHCLKNPRRVRIVYPLLQAIFLGEERSFKGGFKG
jgi:hypothetical protein